MQGRIFIIIFSLNVFFMSAQFGYKKFYFSAGFTGQYMTAPKYTGYDFNLTAIPRYNFAQLSQESTLSIEVRPQIGIGYRNWYKYREYDNTFPRRMSYSIPAIINFNWGLNSEENSLYLVGLYFGAGYSYSNVISTAEPYYDAIHGFVIDAGMRIDGSPIPQIGLMYTIGNDGSRIYSLGFYYDF
jgi:hypothetical protein